LAYDRLVFNGLLFIWGTLRIRKSPLPKGSQKGPRKRGPPTEGHGLITPVD
jgi:hypothetical protein